MCNDINKDSGEVIEECQKVLVDGFVKKVITGNNYQTSIDMGTEGEEKITPLNAKLIKSIGGVSTSFFTPSFTYLF